MPQNRSAIGSFMEGIAGGIETRDRMDKNREFKEYMRQRNAQGAIDLQETYDMGLAQWEMDGGDPAEYAAQNKRYTTMQDPALIRFGKWLGGRLGFGTGSEEQGATQSMDVPNYAVQPAGPQDSGATTYALPEQYKDGGVVRKGVKLGEKSLKERMTNPDARKNYDLRGIPMKPVKKADGGRVYDYTAMDAMDVRGGYRSPSTKAKDEDLERRELDREPIFPRTRDMTDAYSRTADDLAARSAATDDWYEKGDLAWDRTVNRLGQAGSTVAAFGRDIVDAMVPDQAAEAVKGFAGTRDEGAIPPPTSTPPASVESDEKVAAQASIDTPDKSNTQIANQALKEGEAAAIENLDYKLLVDQGVSPEELPTMTTGDWTDYRREMMQSMIARGMNPKEAMQQVDYMTVGTQMRGFAREGQKALLYLQTGQAREAAMALRQAYQYFPNGVGVKFGTAVDPKTGQPSIIAMGVDEETGEPTGKPMLITTERLSTVMENMSNPSAFRTWTKDNHQLQLDIAKLEEQMRSNRAREGIGWAGVAVDAADASGAGGMSASERRMRDKEYRGIMMEEGVYSDEFEDPQIQADLSSAMTIYEMMSGNPPNVVSDRVKDAYLAGGEEGVMQLLQSARRGE